MKNPDSKAAQKLLSTASQLFHERGFSTGVDEIVARAEVAKMSLYVNFRKKDELICDVLERSSEALLGRVTASYREDVSVPQRFQDMLAAACKSQQDPRVLGSLVTRALIEFPKAESAVHQRGVKLKRQLIFAFEKMAFHAQLSEPVLLAQRMVLLFDGFYGVSPVVGHDAALADVKQALRGLLRIHTR